MISFTILVGILMESCLYSLLKDAVKNEDKHFFKYVVKIILLLVAVYFKSINL